MLYVHPLDNTLDIFQILMSLHTFTVLIWFLFYGVRYF